MTKRMVIAIIGVTAILLSGCGAATPEPDLSNMGANPPVVSLTGKVGPNKWVTVSSMHAGRVTNWNVSRGQKVRAGQVLATVGSAEPYQAQVDSANLFLLTKVQEKRELMEDAPVKTADALLALTRARRDYENAKDNAALATPDYYKGALQEAKAWLEKAWARYLWLLEHAPKDSSGQLLIDLAYQEYLHALQAVQKAEKEYLEHPQPTERSQINYDIRQAELLQAQTKLAAAEQHYEDVKNGMDPDILAILDATIRAARSALQSAEKDLADCDIQAPITGTVTSLLVREFDVVLPGQPILIIGDLSALRIETTDLDEVDVVKIKPGLKAEISFDSLPLRKFQGVVESVSPMAESGSGGVNYVAILRIDNLDPAILWGMTAFIDIKILS